MEMIFSFLILVLSLKALAFPTNFGSIKTIPKGKIHSTLESTISRLKGVTETVGSFDGNSVKEISDIIQNFPRSIKERLLVEAASSEDQKLLEALVKFRDIGLESFDFAAINLRKSGRWDLMLIMSRNNVGFEVALAEIYRYCRTVKRLTYLHYLINNAPRKTRLGTKLVVMADAARQGDFPVLDMFIQSPTFLDDPVILIMRQRYERIASAFSNGLLDEIRAFSDYKTWMLLEALISTSSEQADDSVRYLLNRIDLSVNDYLPFKIIVARRDVSLVSTILDKGIIPKEIVWKSADYAQIGVLDYILRSYSYSAPVA